MGSTVNPMCEVFPKGNVFFQTQPSKTAVNEQNDGNASDIDGYLKG
jgi:filamentous hemagglutinin family protein